MLFGKNRNADDGGLLRWRIGVEGDLGVFMWATGSALDRKFRPNLAHVIDLGNGNGNGSWSGSLS